MSWKFCPLFFDHSSRAKWNSCKRNPTQFQGILPLTFLNMRRLKALASFVQPLSLCRCPGGWRRRKRYRARTVEAEGWPKPQDHQAPRLWPCGRKWPCWRHCWAPVSHLKWERKLDLKAQAIFIWGMLECIVIYLESQKYTQNCIPWSQVEIKCIKVQTVIIM